MANIFHNFSSRRKGDSESLSNFHMGKVEMKSSDGIKVYASGEHGFHGRKYGSIAERVTTGEKRKNELMEYAERFEQDGKYGGTTALEAKRKGGKTHGLCLSTNELTIWQEVGVAVQTEICRYKLEHEQKVRKCLAELKGKILIHPTRMSDDKVMDCVWEGRGKMVNGNAVILGGNVLGNIWMELRDGV